MISTFWNTMKFVVFTSTVAIRSMFPFFAASITPKFLFVEIPASKFPEPAAPKIRVVLDLPMESPIGLFVAVYGTIVEHDARNKAAPAIARYIDFDICL